MEYSLSNNDLDKALDHRCNIITYRTLRSFRTLDSALGKYGCLIILYESEPAHGHWICLFKTNDGRTVSFFDSYGLEIDDELNYIPKNFRDNNDMRYPYLSKLLYESPYNIEYNQYELQDFKDDVNTCGRWVLARLKLKNVGVDDFYELFKSKYGISSDELVYAYSRKILNK